MTHFLASIDIYGAVLKIDIEFSAVLQVKYS